MIKLYAIICLFIFLPFLYFYAQESATEVSGRILDEPLSDPFPYIRIELKDLNGRITAETLSDEKDIFHLKNLSNGTYVLQVGMSGFQSYSQKIEIFNKPIVLKDIFLKAYASDEVVKMEERTTIVNKIDRKVGERWKRLYIGRFFSN
ncbi:carboxypeptidase regulatory-like domain-containing protein [Bacteroidetes bacterium endosymbiont of Geopemphigus sp.]|uniref:carboxypeptidase regulatory-like domain-containing protein n=1 Tax=Bacteroidetes bacterium endosymbiont of Geopemphigus sp. TaxID=2047937 RepID=UPI000CD093D6